MLNGNKAAVFGGLLLTAKLTQTETWLDFGCFEDVNEWTEAFRRYLMMVDIAYQDGGDQFVIHKTTIRFTQLVVNDG